MASSANGAISTRKLRWLRFLTALTAMVVVAVAAEVAVRVRQYVKYGSTATLEQQYTVDPGAARRSVGVLRWDG